MRIKPFTPIRPAKIAIVGEAPGESEDAHGTPFVGASGQELTRMLADAGIVREDCYLTNVFLDRPKGNDLKEFCGGRNEAKTLYPFKRPELAKAYPNYPWPNLYNFDPIDTGKYLRVEYLSELGRLQEELGQIRPNIVIALGNTACWAMLGSRGISKIRGTATESSLVRGLKVLPTYHPAAILRTWDLRPIAVADLMKAGREAQFPEIIRPEREVWIEPELADIVRFKAEHLDGAGDITYDVETEKGQITCIGFSPHKSLALVIPFVDKRREGNSYWPTAAEEVQAWKLVREIMQSPVPKIAQNGVYDIQYIWRAHGISPVNCSDDTMLMHHALLPEAEKGLGFLGSVYTNEASWKLMRSRGKEEKKDA